MNKTEENNMAEWMSIYIDRGLKGTERKDVLRVLKDDANNFFSIYRFDIDWLISAYCFTTMHAVIVSNAKELSFEIVKKLQERLKVEIASV